MIRIRKNRRAWIRGKKRDPVEDLMLYPYITLCPRCL
jgi:hypothetical protein